MNYSYTGQPLDETRNVDIDRILQALLLIIPIIHRKLLRMDLGGVSDNLNRPHLAIMRTLGEADMTVSELSRALMIRKSQMTHLVGQLVKMGIVERRPDAGDRRVVNLALTDGGRVLHEDIKRKVRENIKTKLSGLTQEELTAMLAALETLRGIGANL